MALLPHFGYLINPNQAGEDLEEIEEDDEDEVDENEQPYGQPSGSRGVSVLPAGPDGAHGSLVRILTDGPPSKSAATETSPLIPRSSAHHHSRLRRRKASVSHGDATVGQAILMVCYACLFMTCIQVSAQTV